MLRRNFFCFLCCDPFKYPITFDSSDHPKSTSTVSTIPLVCTPTINNIAVSKTLIDGGTGLNVISVETFEKL